MNTRISPTAARLALYALEFALTVAAFAAFGAAVILAGAILAPQV